MLEARQVRFEQRAGGRADYVLLDGAPEQAATLLSNLGYHLQAQAAYDVARPHLEQALAVTRRVLGETHPDTALCLHNLGRLLQDMGDLPAARPLYEQAVTIQRQALGNAHPNNATSLNSLGTLLYAMGDLPAARSMNEPALARSHLRQALKIFKVALPANHPYIQVTLQRLIALPLEDD